MVKSGKEPTKEPGHPSKSFNVVVEKDEDGWLVGKVVELPGCHTQAKTMAELEDRLREAIRLYLEVETTPSAPQFVGIHRIDVPA